MSYRFLNEDLQARPLDISGIENAILDLLVMVEDDTIERLGLHKGTMKLVEAGEQQKILKVVGSLDPEIEAGGSCANVLRMASLLGSRTGYSSAVGHDEQGTTFSEYLGRHGVEDYLARIDGDTGTSVILVTPDGERTMNTHLGVCRQYRSQFVPEAEIRRSKIFFTTGYVWDTPNQIEAIEVALEIARSAGVKLGIDLADPFVVERSKEAIEKHIDLGMDILFSNTHEAYVLTGLDAAPAARELAKRVEVAVVTDGANGAYIGCDGELIHVNARPVAVTDTTGAGDCFAAGFLHGLARGLDLRHCGELAAHMAADTITHLGVKLSPEGESEARRIATSV